VKGNQNMWLPVSPKEIEPDKIKNYIHVSGKQSGQLTFYGVMRFLVIFWISIRIFTLLYW